MDPVGTVSSRFHINARSLEEFEGALTFLSSQGKVTGTDASVMAVKTLLGILQPIELSMSRKLSTNMNLDDYEIVYILHQRHVLSWQDYCRQIQDLIGKLESLNSLISTADVSILNDVADALDIQCHYLLNRTRRH